MDEVIPIIEVLGSRVHVVDVQAAAAQMGAYAKACDGRCRRVVVTGFHGLWEAHKRPEFHRILNSADLWVPDGIAPVWVARLRGHRAARRVPGAELMDAFFSLPEAGGMSSFFYGDSEETLVALRENLKSQYPAHRVAGTFSPPFRSLAREEELEHVRLINESGADVLWVGLGLPKQDEWIYRNRRELKVPVAVGVGAAFRFLAGKVDRAPAWIGRMGLEWLWRLAAEPKKCWRRCVVDGPQFAFHVGMEMAGLRKYGGGRKTENGRRKTENGGRKTENG